MTKKVSAYCCFIQSQHYAAYSLSHGAQLLDVPFMVEERCFISNPQRHLCLFSFLEEVKQAKDEPQSDSPV